MNEWEERSTILVTHARRALERGLLKVPPDTDGVVELMNAPLTPMGLVDIRQLSKEGIAFGRSVGLAVEAENQFPLKEQPSKEEYLSLEDAQCELFRLFSLLFAALTGVAVEYIENFDEISQRLRSRFTNEFKSVSRSFNTAADELSDFYKSQGSELFRLAKGLGGMKSVMGGQRQFTESGLKATRISGLYLDTQLIPDPVYPFFASELPLNAKHLQLAHVLYHVLQLAPLIDARLPVPAVIVFPSFEQPLEEHDAVTKAGIENMLLQVVAPVCDGSINSVSELFEFAAKYPQKFLPAVMDAQLFIPQGHEPGDFQDAKDALNAHIAGIEGRQARHVVDNLKSLPTGVAVTVVMMERLTPQYHLLENANELGAQPLMSLPVQWHYFQLCSKASARELVQKNVLSEANFFTLKALQDESVSWLANIPIAGLVDMRRNMEVVNFREELKKFTAQLAAAGPLELNAVVKEVNHGLSSLIQRHAKAMEDVKAKYWPKITGFAVGAGLGVVSGVGLSFIPALATTLGVTAPAGAAVGALSGGALGAIRELTGSKVEQRQLGRHSLVGMLATAKAQR